MSGGLDLGRGTLLTESGNREGPLVYFENSVMIWGAV